MKLTDDLLNTYRCSQTLSDVYETNLVCLLVCLLARLLVCSFGLIRRSRHNVLYPESNEREEKAVTKIGIGTRNLSIPCSIPLTIRLDHPPNTV